MRAVREKQTLVTGLVSGIAVLGAILIVVLFLFYPVETGRLGLGTRATLGSVGTLLLVGGIRPFLPWFSRQSPVYPLLVGVTLAAISPWYFLIYLPAHAGEGLVGEQLASSMITENTSNGIVEVGFAYPIFTPTVSLRNDGIFTREVDIYLRMLDGNNEPALFRAVRADLPDARLSVEASVRGLLSQSRGFLFIPVAVPPGKTVQGRVVFIISDLNDGSTFDEALGRSYPAEFQVRDSASGELVVSFPMTRI